MYVRARKTHINTTVTIGNCQTIKSVIAKVVAILMLMTTVNHEHKHVFRSPSVKSNVQDKRHEKTSEYTAIFAKLQIICNLMCHSSAF